MCKGLEKPGDREMFEGKSFFLRYAFMQLCTAQEIIQNFSLNSSELVMKHQQINKNTQMCDRSLNLPVLIVEQWDRFWREELSFGKNVFFFWSYREKQGSEVWLCFKSPILWPQMFAQKSHPRPDVNKAWVTFHQASSVFHNLLPLKALQDATHLLLNSVSSNTQRTPGVYLACPYPTVFFLFFFWFLPCGKYC